MTGRTGLGAVALLLLSGMAQAQSSADQRCAVELLETETVAVLEACTLVLAREDLSDAARVSAMMVQSRALHRLGRLDEAILGYEGALHLAPGDPELHLRRGWTAYHKRDFNLALDHGRQALKIKPGYAEAHDLVGAALSDSIGGPEQFAAAKAAYDEAIRLDPSKPLFRFHRFLLLRSKHPKEALQELDDLLQLPASVLTKSAGAAPIRQGRVLPRRGQSGPRLPAEATWTPE